LFQVERSKIFSCRNDAIFPLPFPSSPMSVPKTLFKPSHWTRGSSHRHKIGGFADPVIAKNCTGPVIVALGMHIIFANSQVPQVPASSKEAFLTPKLPETRRLTQVRYALNCCCSAKTCATPGSAFRTSRLAAHKQSTQHGPNPKAAKIESVESKDRAEGIHTHLILQTLGPILRPVLKTRYSFAHSPPSQAAPPSWLPRRGKKTYCRQWDIA